jgi:4-amino-4-deoxy-L-arabinose transferase-like glycosyltransferase
MQFDWGQGYCFNMQADGIEAYSVAVDYANDKPKAQYIGQPNYNGHSKLPGPLWTLFCLSGLQLGGSPEGIMFEILLLNTLAIYLAYLLATRTAGQLAGLWTAFFVATFPRVIAFSVAVYNPNVMPFLGTLFFLALWQVVQQDRSRAVFWIPFIPMLALQFHMSGLMLIPTAIAVIFIGSARLNYLWAGGGFLAGVCIYLPYIKGEMSNHWQNTIGMFSGGTGHFSVEVLKIFSSTVGFLINWSPGWIRDDAEYAEFGRACFGSQYVLYGVYAISTVAAAYAISGVFLEVKKSWLGFNWNSRGKFFRDHGTASGIVFLFLIFALPVLFSLLGGKAFHARYCLVFITPLFGLVGATAARWLMTSPSKKLFRLMLGIVTVANLWIIIGTDIYQKNNIERGPVFIPSFRKLETVYQDMKNHSGQNTPIAVDDVAYGQSLPATDEFLRDALLVGRFVNVREKEHVAPPDKKITPVIYKLCRSDEIRPDDPAIAFYGNGIALVAVP